MSKTSDRRENTTETGHSAKECASSCEERICGVLMPIGDMLECTKEHWADVKSILFSAISSAGFKPQLVSDANEVGVIHERIVRNVYNNEIVVCDVSHKNPNVMFELGMRLAFDKPVVIVKDKHTDYSFDTGVIEHIEYPRDLRHGGIENFKSELSYAIKNTYNASLGKNYRSFLKNFSNIKISNIETKEVDIHDAFKTLQESLASDFAMLRDSILKLKTPTSDFYRVGEKWMALLTQGAIRRCIEEYAKYHNIKEDDINVDDLILWIPEVFRQNYELHNLRKIFLRELLDV